VRFLPVPGGEYRVGTTLEGIDACVREWSGRLISPNYTAETFREWIYKEFPDHRVQVSGFELGETLVSNSDVEEFIREEGMPVPESLRDGGRRDPVWGVSLEWAQRYVQWLTRSNSQFVFRLPTETEWEVAARGSDFREYPYGGEFNPRSANTVESKIGRPTPIDFFAHAPGPFGHLDLAGNVEEWVSTPYRVYPNGRVVEDDLFQRFGLDYSILRGGSFICGGDLSRAARRHGPFPDPKFRFTGFRLVREPLPNGRGH